MKLLNITFNEDLLRDEMMKMNLENYPDYYWINKNGEKGEKCSKKDQIDGLLKNVSKNLKSSKFKHLKNLYFDKICRSFDNNDHVLLINTLHFKLLCFHWNTNIYEISVGHLTKQSPMINEKYYDKSTFLCKNSQYCIEFICIPSGNNQIMPLPMDTFNIYNKPNELKDGGGRFLMYNTISYLGCKNISNPYPPIKYKKNEEQLTKLFTNFYEFFSFEKSVWTSKKDGHPITKHVYKTNIINDVILNTGTHIEWIGDMIVHCFNLDKSMAGVIIISKHKKIISVLIDSSFGLQYGDSCTYFFMDQKTKNMIIYNHGDVESNIIIHYNKQAKKAHYWILSQFQSGLPIGIAKQILEYY